MDESPPIESYLAGGLKAYGIEADALELQVMRGVWDAYQPALELLLAADLTGIEPERDADLSRAPGEAE